MRTMNSQSESNSLTEFPVTHLEFGEEEISALRKVLNSGWATQGPMTAPFEKTYARRYLIDHALACTSCTSALHLSVLAAEKTITLPVFPGMTEAHLDQIVKGIRSAEKLGYATRHVA
jgi:dTDP-4-amino-4,6-dideoxygalactose transaminase